jgi:hypothetical protein
VVIILLKLLLVNRLRELFFLGGRAPAESLLDLRIFSLIFAQPYALFNPEPHGRARRRVSAKEHEHPLIVPRFVEAAVRVFELSLLDHRCSTRSHM